MKVAETIFILHPSYFIL